MHNDNAEARVVQEKTAIFDVLRPSGEQQEGLDALLLEQQAVHEAIATRRHTGEITAEEFVNALLDLRNRGLATLKALLDERQFEVVRIYVALHAVEAMHGGGTEMHGGTHGGSGSGMHGDGMTGDGHGMAGGDGAGSGTDSGPGDQEDSGGGDTSEGGHDTHH